MLMVRDGEKESCVDAACWRLLVMYGGPGFLIARETLGWRTSHDAALARERTSSISGPLPGAFFSGPVFTPSILVSSASNSTPALKRAADVQYSTGTKLPISSSRSCMSLSATDWTRPALRPGEIALHR